ncbi:MAG: purine-binding chemotaxis protein CheW, partial [Lentisphaeria bacterium]
DAFVETKLIRRVKPNVSSSEADSVDDGPSLAGSTAKQPAPEKLERAGKPTQQNETLSSAAAEPPKQANKLANDGLVPSSLNQTRIPSLSCKKERYSEPDIAPPKPREKVKSKGFSNHEVDLAVLDEHKRQRLQQMLSRQALTKTPKSAPTHTCTPSIQTALIAETKAPSAAVPAGVALVDVVEVPADEGDASAEAPSVNDDSEISDTAEVSQSRIHQLLQWSENGRPIWAQNRFEILLFQVAGLSLAVPLVALGQILQIDKKLTPLAGQSEWFMGIMPSALGDIRAVNTALFVMPERYTESFLGAARFLISIDGLPWGLAVDAVNQPISLMPEEVNWRSVRTKRPWLAGTIREKMCALIDIPQMANLLENTSKKKL